MRRLIAVLMYLTLATFAATSAMAIVQCSTNSAATTPHYIPCEFTATGVGGPPNPYRLMQVEATVTPPPGVTFSSKPLKGFWVGPGSTFKFRFTPTAPGAWVLKVSSKAPYDAVFAGEVNRTYYAGSAGSPGFLRRETQSNYTDRFVYDDNSHPFLWGTTYYQIVVNARSATPDWSAAVNSAHSIGIRKIRLLVYPWWGAYSGFPDTQPFMGLRTNCVAPYNTTATCPDYNQLDTGHFDKLDLVIDDLLSRGMIADVIIFKDPADDNHQAAPPPDDNYRTFGENLDQDQRYTKYVVARYAAYPNVTFCLSNEWENTQYTRPNTPVKDFNYLNALGDLVRAEDPYYYNPVTGRFRILTIHSKTARTVANFTRAQTETLGWLVAGEIQWGIRGNTPTTPEGWGTDILTSNLAAGSTNRTTIPFVDEEFGYIGEAQWSNTLLAQRVAHRRAVWGLAIVGLFGTVGDIRNSPQNLNRVIWQSANEYADLRRMIEFFTVDRGQFKINDYWLMRRNTAITSAAKVYALSNLTTNAQIVIYNADGRAFTATLPAGTYNIYKWNPAIEPAPDPTPYGTPHIANASGTVNIAANTSDTVFLCIKQ